jgi:hypothetical protein
MTMLSINIRNVWALMLGMALLPHGTFSTMHADPPAPYNEQWGRLVFAFRSCGYDKEVQKQLTGAPRYGKKYAAACKVLNRILEGLDQDKEEAVKRHIDGAYYAARLVWREAMVLDKDGKSSNKTDELRMRVNLRKLEEQVIQEGLSDLVIAETDEDKRRMIDLEQEYKKGRFERARSSFEWDQRFKKQIFEWEQHKAKEKFEEELRKEQEAEDSKNNDYEK